MKKRTLVGAALLLASFSVNAQDTRHGFFDDWSIGLSLNNYIMRGDVNGLHSIDHTVNGAEVDYLFEDAFNLGFGARLAKQLSPVFDLGLEYNGAKSNGVGLYDNGSKVVSSEVEFSNLNLTSRFSLTRLAEHQGRQPKVNFYLEAGLGRFWRTAEVYRGLKDGDDRLESNTEKIEEEGIWTVPVGLGIEFKLGRRVALGLSSKAQLMRYDQFDGLAGANDFLINNSLWLNFDLASKNGHKWNNSFASMNEGILKNKEDIAKLNSNMNNLNDRVGKVESALSNKVDKKAWKDSDGDGVHNDDDKEANTPKGTLVNFQGISIEKVLGNKGNAKPVFTPVYFSSGRHTVKRDQQYALANIALHLQNNPSQNVTLVGYADKRGSSQVNMEISRKRTESVKKQLVNLYGIDASRISTENKGESVLLSKLDRVNRRVDFVLR